MKYCHEIFNDEIYREGLRTLLLESAYNYEIPIGEPGFDDNHVHFMADIGNYSRSEVEISIPIVSPSGRVIIREEYELL